jgi:serine phosphatase RsbU (regulator of sigma subunit)
MSDGQVDLPVPAPVAVRPGTGWRSPARVMSVVILTGLLVTAAASLTAWRIDKGNEHRLLQAQTRQAANVVSSAIVNIQSPLQTAVDIARATDGSPAQFTRFMAAYTAPNGLFASASLWQITGSTVTQVASAGGPPATASAAPTLIAQAVHSATFDVASLVAGGERRVGYALASHPDSTYAVYAERAIAANRQAAVESNPAFGGLHYASYLGSTTATADLQTTDVADDQLPLSGDTVRESIPFGDTTLTLVTSPIGHLGGTFAADLQWIFLGSGIALTALGGLAAGRFVTRRRDAEQDAQTIAGLYARLDALYSEQRGISEALQRALLPQSNPTIPDLEIASRYVAGAHGVDVGGDWYSIVAVDDTHFGFVVGDVSGRGVEAATLMGRVRYTLRAYLLEGHPPHVALEMCSRQVDIGTDGHFATVLVGRGDLATRQLTLASAGHLEPLLLSGDQSRFVPMTIGRPLGVAPTAYVSTTIEMEPGSTLLGFTDGLVERRDEALSVGLQRLAQAALPTGRPVDDMVTGLLAAMTRDGADDDIAILAFTWTGRGETS